MMEDEVSEMFDPISFVESLRSTLEYYNHRERTAGDVSKDMYKNLVQMVEQDLIYLKQNMNSVV